MKTRQDPICPVEVGHHTNVICNLSDIATRLGRKLRWDPAQGDFLNDDQANRMLARAMRPPWHIFETHEIQPALICFTLDDPPILVVRSIAALEVPPGDLEKIQQAAPSEAPAKTARPRRLLVFTLAQGFVHEATPWGVAALRIMGEKTGAYTASPAKTRMSSSGIPWRASTPSAFSTPASRPSPMRSCSKT